MNLIAVERNDIKHKKVRLDLDNERMSAKSQSYANICAQENCENNQTRLIVGRYNPALLTKLKKEAKK